MLQISCLSLCFIIFIGVSNTLCENSASVHQVIPRNNKQLYLLRKLDRKLKDISYWTDPVDVNKTVDLLVSEDQHDKFDYLMRENDLTYKIQIPNVQHLLDESAKSQLESNIKRLFYARSESVNNFSWTKFHTLDEIYSWLDKLAITYPSKVSVVVAGNSAEKRPIKGVHLKFSEGKKGVFLESGIHAREWLSHATSTYIINELLTSTKPEIRQLAESYEWYIFPCVNPDGYAFTHVNPESRNYRLWRKTRSKQTLQRCSGFFCRKQDCYGADPNRNWGFHWGGQGSDTDDPCSEIYAGKSLFSEVEMKSLSRYIDSVAHNLFAYISFHSYGQKLIFPYGYTRKRMDDYDLQYSVARDTVIGLSKKYGTQYEIGSIGEIIGVTSGSSLDWVKASHRIPFVYCYELRGQTSSNKFYGFVAPPSEIIPNGDEVVDSLVSLFRSAAKSTKSNI